MSELGIKSGDELLVKLQLEKDLSAHSVTTQSCLRCSVEDKHSIYFKKIELHFTSSHAGFVLVGLFYVTILIITSC